MKTSFRHCFATVLLVALVVGFGTCANRGMEAPGNPLRRPALQAGPNLASSGLATGIGIYGFGNIGSCSS
jgi:hypothetical protein